MTRIGRIGANVRLELTEPESALLDALLSDYLALLGDPAQDPAGGRLFPAAYGADREASAEFAERTRDRALAEKVDRAELVASAVRLDPPLELGPPVVETWLRVLTDLRLVLARRLDLHQDEDPVPDTDLGLLYQWLGMLQETLLAALTEDE
jgi:hypothetical protein